VPPALSLANGMWLGKMPWQLERLTLPEQLLVAQLYPRVFVFKLFPKDIHRQPDASSLQQAMRGSVSGYDLDVSGVVSMVQGNLKPRPTVILASVIAVTFIGQGTLPKRWLQSIFRVCQQFVYEALQRLKLKANNMKRSVRVCDFLSPFDH
jgi:hypothetical protein